MALTEQNRKFSKHMIQVVLEVLVMSFPSQLLYENGRPSQEQEVLEHALDAQV